MSTTGATFEALFDRERSEIVKGRPGKRNLSVINAQDDSAHVSAAGDLTGEPKVDWVDDEFLGLALSGGGIRSATFNLGLLQGLEERGLLGSVDYLSTVSGGGYVGGWWSASLARREKLHLERGDQQVKGPDPQRPNHAKAPEEESSGSLFSPDLTGKNDPESREVRHLREFSKFLVPRLGMLETETHRAVAHIARVMTMSVLGSLALFITLGSLWLLLVSLNGWGNWGVYLSTLVLLVVAHVLLMGQYGQVNFGDIRKAIEWRMVGLMLCLALSVGARVGWSKLDLNSTSDWPGQVMSRIAPNEVCRDQAEQMSQGVLLDLGRSPYEGHADEESTSMSLTGSVTYLWRLGKMLFMNRPELFFGPLSILLLCYAAVLLQRLGFGVQRIWPGVTEETRIGRLELHNFVTNRLLVAAGVWCAFAATWKLGLLLLASEEVIRVSVGVAAVLGLFEVAKRYLLPGVSNLRTETTWRTHLAVLVPKTLATAALMGMAVLLAAFMVSAYWSGYLPMLGIGFAVVLLAFVLMFDPKKTSLFSYYRERIIRAFLGASNLNKSKESELGNRCTEEQCDDDMPLDDLVARPLHLVCTAVNDLGGDPLARLGRGAASGVLSRNGLSIGDQWYPVHRLPGTTLGEAVTASGAAFNSNMGAGSQLLGIAGSILLTALNLRLGLWIKPRDGKKPIQKANTEQGAPERFRRQYWGGWLFFLEMFQVTRIKRNRRPMFHLSDGGHFDNLGLYELLRRHCSYIIVSDAGADPSVEFADIGNALQLAREDFGIEIDIDFNALKPSADRVSRSRVAVGRIIYPAGKMGLLIYVKPTIVGDEPEDINQYRCQSSTFPHETTTDQFYDRAQWESYRMLGHHTARKVFRFLSASGAEEIGDGGDTGKLEWIFQRVFAMWTPIPPEVLESTTAANARFSDLIGQLRASSSPLAEQMMQWASGGQRHEHAAREKGHDLALQMLDVLCLIQTMEDAFGLCRLDEFPFHKATGGWYDLFERVTASHSFRCFWPFLRCLYGRDFVAYVEKEFFWLRDNLPKGLQNTAIEFSIAHDSAFGVKLAERHPRSFLTAGEYKEGWQYIVKVSDDRNAHRSWDLGGRVTLAAIPGKKRWTNANVVRSSKSETSNAMNVREELCLLELRDVLVLPGTGGLPAAARFLRRLVNEPNNDALKDAALCIRATDDQNSAPQMVNSKRSAAPREFHQVTTIHRRASPFIEDRLGTLELWRLSSGETNGARRLCRYERSSKNEGELVGLIRLGSSD